MKPMDERKYNECSMIEDEFHVVMRCSSYEDVRIEVIDEISDANPPFGGLSDEQKFIELITMNNQLFMHALSKLTKNISQVRGCL